MWKIQLDGKQYKIELLISSMSGMKRILKDGYLIFEKQMRFGNFHHSMPIGNHMISIIELEDRYDFRIDNQPFSMLYMSEKTKANFRKEGEDGYDNYNPKPYSQSYTQSYSHPQPKPKKRDNLEFDTGFEMFDYKPSHDSSSKPYTSKPKKPIDTHWNDNSDPLPEYTEYKAPPPEPKEDFNWDKPTSFQFEENNAPAPAPAPAPAQSNPPPYTQPARAPQAPAPLQPPPQISMPAPVQEPPKPIIDLLDTDQQDELPDDLFSNGLGITPIVPGQQRSPPAPLGILDFPQQQVTNQTVSGSPLNLNAPVSLSPSAQVNQPPMYQTTNPSQLNPPLSSPQYNQPQPKKSSDNFAQYMQTSINPPLSTQNPSTYSNQYSQPASTPPTPFNQPPMNPNERNSSPDLGDYFNAPTSIFFI
jgi:hypothetical protein